MIIYIYRLEKEMSGPDARQNVGNKFTTLILSQKYSMIASQPAEVTKPNGNSVQKNIS